MIKYYVYEVYTNSRHYVVAADSFADAESLVPDPAINITLLDLAEHSATYSQILFSIPRG